MSTIAVRALITGTVQGVFFRASCLEQAQNLNLFGSVENLETDTVAIVAQGDRNAVEELLVWAHTGSPDASVREVHIRSLDLDEERNAFRVLRPHSPL
ncbi:MAG: acylphosphatase [Deltaproteobacteria bacterium]|nr:acylphosphatase [Deltaproteobacteria bacterium]